MARVIFLNWQHQHHFDKSSINRVSLIYFAKNWLLIVSHISGLSFDATLLREIQWTIVYIYIYDVLLKYRRNFLEKIQEMALKIQNQIKTQPFLPNPVITLLIDGLTYYLLDCCVRLCFKQSITNINVNIAGTTTPIIIRETSTVWSFTPMCRDTVSPSSWPVQ
jgi:hypothetical protein